jgi:hypothetical protein
MAGRTRTDQLVYGRYNDAVVWPLLIVAIGWLACYARRERRRTVILTIAGCAVLTLELGLLLTQLHDETFAASAGIKPMVAGLIPFETDTGRLRPLVVTALALLVALVIALCLVARAGVRVVVVLVAVLVLLGGVRTHRTLASRWNLLEPSGRAVAQLDGTVIPDGATLGVRFVPDELQPSTSRADQLRLTMVYQWYLEDHDFADDFGTVDVGPYVFAPTNDPLFVESGAEVVWVDPRAAMALWYDTPGDDRTLESPP